MLIPGNAISKNTLRNTFCTGKALGTLSRTTDFFNVLLKNLHLVFQNPNGFIAPLIKLSLTKQMKKVVESSSYDLFLKTYHIDFKTDAKGVTPIPAPMHIHTGYLKTSCVRKKHYPIKF